MDKKKIWMMGVVCGPRTNVAENVQPYPRKLKEYIYALL
jgi:hypothetical protein